MQNWFGHSDSAMEEALYETILHLFAGLSLERIPDEKSILNFRRLLEKNELAGVGPAQKIVSSTLFLTSDDVKYVNGVELMDDGVLNCTFLHR